MSVLRYNEEYHACCTLQFRGAVTSYFAHVRNMFCMKSGGEICQFEKICEILGESNVRALVNILCPIS